jgi:hypothetical protein
VSLKDDDAKFSSADAGRAASKWLLAAILAAQCLLPITAVAATTHGMVTVTRYGCDYFLVQTPLGYSLLEWYGGATPDRGDTVSGVLEEYGFHSIYDVSSRHSIRVYIEDYWLDEDDASDQLNEKCE